MCVFKVLWFTGMLEVISMATITLHWLILHVKGTNDFIYLFLMFHYAVQWNNIFSINGSLMREK